MSSQFRLFLGCFMALVATGIGFVVRGGILEELTVQFNLSQEQVGYIQGAGLYPFAISIILFSLVVDKIGYGRSMVFAFIGHIVSTFLMIFATDFKMLYFGAFVFALSNGVVEAVINPVVATIYDKEKTHWLNILHAGWPGGLVLGGVLAIAMGSGDWLTSVLPGEMQLWKWKMTLVLIPTVLYGVLLVGPKFPVQERVAAGVTYMDMLKEFGTGSCLIASALTVMGLNQILLISGMPLPEALQVVLVVVPTIIFAAKVRTFGRPMFVFLLLVMFLLATTELGTDSWIQVIMGSVLDNPVAGSLVLIYTSLIMFVLRFFAGPIVHRISPLGLLAASAAVATGGLLWLANAGSGPWAIFLAATCYGIGKTFFWPTTLGVVSEQYPKGGALMLNAIAAVGLLAVGVLGNPGIGYVQDRDFSERMAEKDEQLLARVVTEKEGVFGIYDALDQNKRTKLTSDEDKIVKGVLSEVRQSVLGKIAVLPAIMFVCYLILIGYYRSKGGYVAEVLTGHAAEDEEFTGGVEGPPEP